MRRCRRGHHRPIDARIGKGIKVAAVDLDARIFFHDRFVERCIGLGHGTKRSQAVKNPQVVLSPFSGADNEDGRMPLHL